MIGQIAAALLLEGEFGTKRLLLPATLKRIGIDLERERQARDWLKGARRLAQERTKFRGLSTQPTMTAGHRTSSERALEDVESLAIEPRLVLCPIEVDRASWRVLLEILDLSNLLVRFPSLRDSLTESRCVVAGARGRPLARGLDIRSQGIQQFFSRMNLLLCVCDTE